MRYVFLLAVCSALLAVRALGEAESPPALLVEEAAARITGRAEPCYWTDETDCTLWLVPPFPPYPGIVAFNCNEPCMATNTCCDENLNCIAESAIYHSQNTYPTALQVGPGEGGKKNRVPDGSVTCWNGYWCNESPCTLFGTVRLCNRGSLREAGFAYAKQKPDGQYCVAQAEEPDDP